MKKMVIAIVVIKIYLITCGMPYSILVKWKKFYFFPQRMKAYELIKIYKIIHVTTSSSGSNPQKVYNEWFFPLVKYFFFLFLKIM